MTSAPTVVPVRVPRESDFDEDDDFLDDQILDALLLDVIGSYEALRHIEEHGISVRAVWRKKGGKSKGKLVYTRCVQPTGLLAHFCTVDFVVWVAADNVFLESWTTVQIRKLLYHAARYIGWAEGTDEHDAHAVLLQHDLELFLGEITDTGMWDRKRDALAHELQQSGVLERSMER